MSARTIRRRSRLPWWVWILIVVGVLITLSLIYQYTMLDAIQRQSREVGEGTAILMGLDPQTGRAPLVTLAQFNRLRVGMTYDQAVAILGSPGELISENQMAGYHTVMYQWWGAGAPGANMNAMFQNGRLIQRSQIGLQ